MVICERTLLREDVRNHFDYLDKIHGEQDKKLLLKKFYHIPKLLKTIKKMEKMNAKFFDEQITDHDITKGFFTHKEIEFFGKIWRMSSDNFTCYYERVNPLPSDVEVKTDRLNGVPVEWNIPRNAQEGKVILYFHGGGYVIGSVNEDRKFVSRLAKLLNTTIISVEYRLAPMFPFPAQIEDNLSVYNYLIENGYSADKIVMSGASAGGHLVLSSLLKYKEVGIKQPKAAFLLSPLTDETLSDPSFFKNGPTDPVLGDICVATFIGAFLGNVEATHPLISPLFSDLTGLCPLFFSASTCEMLYSDSVRFVENAKKQGVKAVLSVYDDMTHCFPQGLGDGAPYPEIKQSLNDIADFLRQIGFLESQ